MMENNQHIYGQPVPPESERNMSQWERLARDQRLNDMRANIAANPAIWSKLREIEALLDRVLDLLQHHAKPDEQNPSP